MPNPVKYCQFQCGISLVSGVEKFCNERHVCNLGVPLSSSLASRFALMWYSLGRVLSNQQNNVIESSAVMSSHNDCHSIWWHGRIPIDCRSLQENLRTCIHTHTLAHTHARYKLRMGKWIGNCRQFIRTVSSLILVFLFQFIFCSISFPDDERLKIDSTHLKCLLQ